MHRVSAAVHACAALGGIARTSQLRRLGVPQRALRSAVDCGALIRLREGLYAHPMAQSDVRTAAAHGGMLACVSAAAAAGLWTMPYEGLHVAVDMCGRVHSHERCRCVVHRTSGVVTLGGRAELPWALAAMLRCQGHEAFFVALESALRQQHLSADEFDRLRNTIPAGRRWLLDFARSDADSGLESLVRLRFHSYGVEMRPQVEIPGVGRVDFVVGDRLIIELDGRENHEGRELRHRDLMRDAIAAGLGFETLRFDYAMIMHDWETVVAVVLAKVDAGSHLS